MERIHILHTPLVVETTSKSFVTAWTQ